MFLIRLDIISTNYSFFDSSKKVLEVRLNLCII